MQHPNATETETIVLRIQQFSGAQRPRPRDPLLPSPTPLGTIGSAIRSPVYKHSQQVTWRELCRAQRELLPNRATPAYLDARRKMQIDEGAIPSLAEMNARLGGLHGWRLVRSEGYVHPEDFFRLLRDKLFPCIDLPRDQQEILYTSEPDMFHDVMGHVVMLADPTMSEYYQLFGRVGQRCRYQQQLEAISRFYWFTIEFGLANPTVGTAHYDATRTRAYGAALLTGLHELVTSVSPTGVERIPFRTDQVLMSPTDVHRMNEVLYEVPSLEHALTHFCEWAKSESLL